jgi:rsbT co-antagonist protein RsbR
LPALLARQRTSVLAGWLKRLLDGGLVQGGKVKESELNENATRLLDAVLIGLKTNNFSELQSPEWTPARQVLEALSRSWAANGFTPSETATFVLSLKEPLFDMLRGELIKTPEALMAEIWTTTQLVDRLGLISLEAFVKNREEVIKRQQEELLELSTPVVRLWEGILALPVIGTLDSERTQTVMENLLQSIVDTGAEIAIIDITGVPTVDTLVAQHLIKTVSAARLMGADCIISGIRPQIAQTIVHLGLDLDVVSKATMADAFALALRRTGKSVRSNGAPNDDKR